MTSPVDTMVKNFNSTMLGAPVLNGVAGAAVALFDACLVTGFDTKALVSLVALAGVMTATFVGTHSSQVDSVLLVAGVTGGPTGFAGANGEQKVVAAPGPTTRTWATALPDGTYTGTITIKMAPAGWEKVFTGTNKAVYRSLDLASSKMLLRVDDSGTTAARVVGYEAMTDVDTGTGAFPTAVQMSGGGYWVKSAVANATAIAWTLQSDGRIFYLTTSPLAATTSTWLTGVTRFFGDGIPYKPGGDAYFCLLSYEPTLNVSNPVTGALGAPGGSTTRTIAAPRLETGLGSAVLTTKAPFTGGIGDTSGFSSGVGPFPSPVDGSLWLSKIYSTLDGVVSPRGEYPGYYHVPQSGVWNTFKMNDIAPGSGPLAGRKLQAVSTSNSMNSVSPVGTGVAFVDITGPWR